MQLSSPFNFTSTFVMTKALFLITHLIIGFKKGLQNSGKNTIKLTSFDG